MVFHVGKFFIFHKMERVGLRQSSTRKRERYVLVLNWYNVTECLLHEVNCGPLSHWELLLNSFYDYSSSFITFFSLAGLLVNGVESDV